MAAYGNAERALFVRRNHWNICLVRADEKALPGSGSEQGASRAAFALGSLGRLLCGPEQVASFLCGSSCCTLRSVIESCFPGGVVAKLLNFARCFVAGRHRVHNW